MNHTPGPWGIKESLGAITIARCGSYFALAEVLDNSSPEEEIAANAKLIAASPELLAAVQKLIPHVLHYAAFTTADPSAHKDAADARAAISKATGG